MNRNNKHQIINKYMDNMENFCRKNELTMTLIKKEPIEEAYNNILEEKNEQDIYINNESSECNEFGKNNPINMKIMNKMKSMKTMYVVMNLIIIYSSTGTLPVFTKLLNVSTKLRPQIKSLGSPSYSASSISIENPSIITYEYKKKNYEYR